MTANHLVVIIRPTTKHRRIPKNFVAHIGTLVGNAIRQEGGAATQIQTTAMGRVVMIMGPQELVERVLTQINRELSLIADTQSFPNLEAAVQSLS